ncbi:MAG: shikimate kinase [Actinomycetes bacterium]
MPPVVVLIGSPGAGKSSVGKRVAGTLKVPFVDSDRVIEDETGMTIADFFVDRGEGAFRDLEADAVARCLAVDDAVLALGGGAVLRPETQERLAGHRVVWLKVSLHDAAQRVGLNQARPLLLGNVRGTLATLLERREPIYSAVATDVVETSGRSVKQVADEVVKAVRRD